MLDLYRGNARDYDNEEKCVGLSRTEINVQLTLTLTNTALDGSPLDSNGVSIPG